MHLIDEFAQRAKNYLSQANIDPVYPSDSSIYDLKTFDTALQQSPVDPADVLKLLDDAGSPATVKTTGGRFYGFVIGGCLPAALYMQSCLQLYGIRMQRLL